MSQLVIADCCTSGQPTSNSIKNLHPILFCTDILSMVRKHDWKIMWCNTTIGDWKNFTRHGQCVLQTFKSHTMLWWPHEILPCNKKANQDAEAEVLWQTLFSRAIGAPVDDFAVWTQWSFLELSYLVSINSTFSLSLSYLITSYFHFLPVSGGSILSQNLKVL